MVMKRCTPWQNLSSECANLVTRLTLALILFFVMALSGAGTAKAHTDDPPEKTAPHSKGSHAHHGKSATIGATVYKHMCTFCHGEDGNGGGKAMAYLYPWPRDFRKGVFKHRTTPSGSLPLDEDIYRTIVRGIPGTAMPAWESALTEDETWAVIEYIKNFSQRFKTEKPKKPVLLGTPSPATNAGTINVSAKAQIGSASARGVDIDSNSGAFKNSGKITVKAVGGGGSGSATAIGVSINTLGGNFTNTANATIQDLGYLIQNILKRVLLEYLEQTV